VNGHRRIGLLVLVALMGVAVGIPTGAEAAGTGLFSWFRPSIPPGGFRDVALPSGSAVLFYPARFRLVAGDPGTVTAGLRDRAGNTIGYLNATPQQGDETLVDWPAFRIDHQRGEETAVREGGSLLGLRFRGGKGSCVIDDYTTPQGHHRYREIACFVKGQRTGSVIVAAAPPSTWTSVGSELHHAISAYQVR
jgi:hypothetical protein